MNHPLYKPKKIYTVYHMTDAPSELYLWSDKGINVNVIKPGRPPKKKILMMLMECELQ